MTIERKYARITPKPDVPYDKIEAQMQPGDLIESPHPNEVMADCWLYRCPECDRVWTMCVPATHQIVQRNPLTVNPSWLCPAGCHYWIRNGEIVNA